MAIAGPDGVDAAIKSGVDLDGTPIPAEMLILYKEVMDLESQRARSGVKKSMSKRIVKTGSKHFDQATLDAAKAIRATHPDALDTILRAQRPVPTAATAAPTAALSTDPIQTQADALGIPYHEAAAGGTQ